MKPYPKPSGCFSNRFPLVLAALVILSFVLYACSQHKNTLVSKTFHNTTARYNAYFLAREKMKEVEKKIWQAHIDDYNKVLKIYPTLEDAIRSSIKSDLDYIIEKSALPINKHKNSKWVDDSYNLYGKARLYQKEYKLAIETFKYVNTKSDDTDARHTAMTLLLRTFLDSVQLDNARAVNDFLKKEKISDINAAEYYLTTGFYYQTQEDFENVKINLEKALPHIKKREDKARIHFIIGQIYQLQGNDQEAYNHYSAVFKNNPPYELFFYARLYLAQVSSLANSDRKKIDKYFRKLLKDQKNVEYRDKIYYEMGKYELKQENYNKAVKNFETSVSENKGNPFQKARSYLALGELYYDKLHKYELSKLYYDSTIALWDKEDKDYKPISNRQKILEEFVHYYKIVQREDSLQKLAKMDKNQLDKFFDQLIIDEAKKQREMEERIARQAEMKKKQEELQMQQQGFERPGAPGFTANKEWYFYNAASITAGKADFLKKWGKRPLEDNWRRSKKQTEVQFEEQQVAAEEDEELTPEKMKEDSLLAVKSKKEEFLKDIPATEADLDSSHARIEDALYNLGKIYNLKLNEQDNSINAFNDLLARYPTTELKPEIFYFLYLIYKNRNDPKYELYRDKLFKEFPNSQYAKVIINPNYLVESKILNKEAADLYKKAFELHKAGFYISSDSLIAHIRLSYPDNDISDKLAFLSVLNKGKTQSPVVYINLLKGFTNEFPESSLEPRAKELIVRTEEYIQQQSSRGFVVEDQVKYIKNFERPHLFVFLLDQKNLATSERISQDINKFGKLKRLQVKDCRMLPLKDSTLAIFVEGFPDKQSAKDYLEGICEKDPILKKYDAFKISSFIISSDNFKILEESGNTATYLRFFKRNYNDNLIYGD